MSEANKGGRPISKDSSSKGEAAKKGKLLQFQTNLK